MSTNKPFLFVSNTCCSDRKLKQTAAWVGGCVRVESRVDTGYLPPLLSILLREGLLLKRSNPASLASQQASGILQHAPPHCLITGLHHHVYHILF